MRDCGSLKRAQKGRETCPFRAPNGFNEIRLSALERMAGTTRLELATSAVTERFISTYNDLQERGRHPKSLQDSLRHRYCVPRVYHGQNRIALMVPSVSFRESA